MKIKKRTLTSIILGAVALIGTILLCVFVRTNVEDATSIYYRTIVSLLPPIIAILLALITKEVYSSLFIGVVVGALLNCNFKPVATIEMIFKDGLVGTALNDTWNLGILVFLVVLGTMVVMMNKAGGSAAFGRWSQRHIKTKVGASIATIVLGILIFIDDYFNCLTVGSVMSPVAKEKGISKEKLAYLIDATAAPICIIAPISSWAAAVSGFTPEGTNGLLLFIKAIPYNFYALLTIVMMFVITFLRFDYGPMKKAELAAMNSEDKLDALVKVAEDQHKDKEINENGSIFHLIVPVVLLIVCCVLGMVYTGGLFEGAGFAQAFADADASIGLVYGSAIALVLTVIYFVCTKGVNFKGCMESIPEGFKNMVPAILILVFAWTLKYMTDSLGAAEYVASLVKSIADKGALMALLPAVIFAISLGLAFATGTSWGTFGILIPIVIYAFSGGMSDTVDMSNELMIICVSASMAGAVCGDHCSPISDTTIMASAGAGCEHVKHVSTQLPYALTVAGVSVVSYVLAGFIKMWYVVLPISIGLMVGTIFVVRFILKRRER